MKKFLLSMLIFFAAVIAVIYFYRYDIFQYSAESIIQKNLPNYIEVDKIVFDLEKGSLEVLGLAIKNPPEYSNKYLARIDKVICKYGMKAKNILDGIEIKYIEAKDAVIYIERLANGEININNMEELMKPGGQTAQDESSVKPESRGQRSEVRGQKSEVRGQESDKKSFKDINIAKLIKLPDSINIQNGKIEFNDRAIYRKPYVTTFDEINGEISLHLNDSYTEVLGIATSGSGILNGRENQEIEWRLNMDPRVKEITLSSRFDLKEIDITHFRPYYETYSPVEILNAYVSGTLIFDFDHGNIGSSNTLRLKNLKFNEDTDSKKSSFWEAPIADIVKYLQSSEGEVYFDFKIKGDIKNPKFLPGPIVKEAIQRYAVDKISELFSDKGEEGSNQGEGQSDTEKVVNVLKGLLNK